LRAAVTTLAEQRIACQAFGVHATENRCAIGDIAEAEHNVLAPGGFFEKAAHGERGKRGRQLGSSDENDGHRVLLISDFTEAGIVTAGSYRRLS
jgi:hypothetical protein